MTWTWLLLAAAVLAAPFGGGLERSRVDGLVRAGRLDRDNGHVREPGPVDGPRRRGRSWLFVGARGRNQRRREVLAAVRLLVAELGAGARPAAALEAAAGVDMSHAALFVRAADAQRDGADAAQVLRADDEIAFIGHAWAVAMATGAPPADVLARAAADFAAQDERCRAVATALAGARASATVMAVLPLLGVVLGAGMGARPLPTLFGTAPGRVALVAGVLLDVLGLAWTGAISRRASRG